jgi:hypothetical protein
VQRLRAARASDNLMAAVVKQSPSGGDLPSAEAAQLRERFEEAVRTLKGNRRGGRTLYDVPWYVFIGPPGSGKTTVLLHSGLNFPVEQRAAAVPCAASAAPATVTGGSPTTPSSSTRPAGISPRTRTSVPMRPDGRNSWASCGSIERGGR